MNRERTRRALLRGGVALGAGGVAGCIGSLGGGEETTARETTDAETETRAGTETETTTQTPTKVGMVYSSGGLGDKSYNDMANRGVKSARLDFGVEFENESPEGPDDFERLQRSYAESGEYDLVCCIGFDQVAGLQTVATDFPDQRFMIVDGVVEQENVASYVFKPHEGSFQAGHLAARVTATQIGAGAGETSPGAATVGFLGGIDVPAIRIFQAGFEAGVAHPEFGTDVLSRYAGSFNDPDTGEQLATEMYEEGADVVYHAAGGTGVGLFRAAQNANRYAIGVDSDQSESNPRYADVILASMVKRVNNAVYQSIRNEVNDSFRGGSTISLGLKADGVSMVYGAELGSAIPVEAKEALEASERGIVEGDISVPTSLEGGE
jgi:basic membrane protein A